MLGKLVGFGFSSGLVDLLASYLRDRSLVVQYNYSRSNFYVLRSGVLQDSNLGPLLFNDVCAGFRSNALLYADDLKLYTAVGCVEDAEDLQHDIGLLERWCTANALRLNYGKCSVVTFTRKKNILKVRLLLG